MDATGSIPSGGIIDSTKKFLVIGDPHFKTSNVAETDNFIEKTVAVATQQQPEFIIILGDVLHEHERLHTIPLNKAYEFIKSMSLITKTFVIVGNHDLINNQQFLTQEHWMNGMKEWPNTVIVDTPTTHHIDQYNFFVLCPYVPNGRLIEALDSTQSGQAATDWRNANILFVHQEFLGCRMGAIESQDGDVWDKSLPPVISGHIHSNQRILDGHIYYPGSAMQNAFGDPKTILALIDLKMREQESLIDSVRTINPGECFGCTEIDLGLKKKRIVYLDLDIIDTPAGDNNLNKIMDSKDDIKLSLSGDYDTFRIFLKTQKCKQLFASGVKVVHKNKKTHITSRSSTEDGVETSDRPPDRAHGEGSDGAEGVAGGHEGECLDSGTLDESLDRMVMMMVAKERDSFLQNDFNYIFLGHEKDEESFIL